MKEAKIRPAKAIQNIPWTLGEKLDKKRVIRQVLYIFNITNFRRICDNVSGLEAMNDD